MKINSIKDWIKDLCQLLKGDSTKATLIKDGVWSLVINASNRVFTLIIGVILIRILGKEQYGIYTYIISMVIILIIPVEHGVSNLIVRETAQAITKNEPGKINGIWRWSVRVTFWSSLIIISMGIIVTLFFTQQLFDKNQIWTFYWGLAFLLCQAMVHISSAAMRGMKKIVLGQLPDLFLHPALFIALFLISWFILPLSLSSATAMALRMISSFIALLISIGFMVKITPKGIFSSSPIYKTKKWISSVLPLGLSSGLNMIKNHGSILIMGLFVTASQIGSYQVAVSTAALTALVLHSMNMLLAPQFASYFVQEEKKKLQQLVTMSSRTVFLFNLVMTLVFVLFGKVLLTWIFGPDLVDAYPALLILLAGQLVNSFVGSVAFLLNMTGHEKDVMKVLGVSAAINISITLILTPYYGIVGASLATSISLIFAQIAMFFLVKKRLGIVSAALIRTG